MNKKNILILFMVIVIIMSFFVELNKKEENEEEENENKVDSFYVKQSTYEPYSMNSSVKIIDGMSNAYSSDNPNDVMQKLSNTEQRVSKIENNVNHLKQRLNYENPNSIQKRISKNILNKINDFREIDGKRFSIIENDVRTINLKLDNDVKNRFEKNENEIQNIKNEMNVKKIETFSSKIEDSKDIDIFSKLSASKTCTNSPYSNSRGYLCLDKQTTYLLSTRGGNASGLLG